MAMLHIFLGFVLVACSVCDLNILHVKPTSNLELSGCLCVSDWPCKILDEFVDNSTVYLNNNDNLTMIFLPGQHDLTKKLIIRGTTSLNMVGADDCLPGFDSGIQKPIKTARISLKANLTVEGALNFSMSGLTIDGQNGNIVTFLTVGRPIAGFMVSIEDITIVRSGLLLRAENRLFSNHKGMITLSNMIFISSTVLFDFEKTNHIGLKDVKFSLGSTSNAVTFCSLISSVSMQNIEIVSLDNDESAPALQCCSDLFHFQIERMCDVTIYLASGFIIDLNRSFSILISNSSFSRPFGAGVCAPNPPAGKQWNWFLEIIIENSVVSSHAEGGIDMETGYLKNLSLSLINTVISSNTNRSLSASALSVRKSTNENNEDAKIIMEVINTTFEDNNHLILGEQQTTLFILGVTNVSFENCRFINNVGSAIRAINTEESRFVGQSIFRNNTGYRGGALYLHDSAIGLEQNSSMIFKDNTAKDIGGAIYIDDSTTVQCFLRLLNHHKSSPCQSSCPKNQTCYGLKFIANVAANGGESIFGSIQQPCDLKHLHCAFQTSNRLSYSSLASTPTRVCLCPEERSKTTVQQFCTNMSMIFNSKSVYPGEEFHLEAVLVGELFGTGVGSVYAQFMDKDGEGAKLRPPYQNSQRVNNYNICQQLNYTVYSHKSKEVLVLTTSGTVVVSFTDKEDLTKDDRDTDRNYKTMLSTPVYINLTLLPCPPGFYLNGNPPGCDCVPALYNQNLQCSLSNGTGYVYRNGTIWIRIDNESVTIQNNCPFEYCREDNSAVTFNDSDGQCIVNRAGVLCGACGPGYSLALGSNKCLPCPNNNNASLLIFFVAAGFLLVFFIKILNTTVSQGTINGLIFYTNIIWAYESIFFPNDDTNLGKARFLKTFIAWLNLDLGIETCFIQGLTAYAKTWLQFVFPLYICAIVVVMIVSAHYSRHMTRLLGNNSVQVLATLLLLIYAKFLRTIIIALVPASLYTYLNNGQLIDQQSVWAFDGNLPYGGYHSGHLFLFLAALLTLLIFILPYTAILLFFQYLRRGTSYKILQWVIKLIPFFETYFGPFKIKYFYWVGLLLVVRCFLFAVFILTYSSIPSAGLLAILVTVTVLFTIFAYTGRIYRNRFLSLFEYSFFVNLQVLAATLLFIELTKSSSKELIVCLSVGVVFAQFIGIVVYHTWLRVSKILAIKHDIMPYLKTMIKKERAQDDDQYYAYQLMPEDSDKVSSEKSSILDEINKESFLEDHAIDADKNTAKVC